MLHFYRDRIREIPSILRDSLAHVDKYTGIGTLVYFITLGLLSRPVAGRLVDAWAGIPLWAISLGLLAWVLAIFTWGLAKANYAEFQKLKARIPEESESIDNRKAARRLLGEAQAHGRELAAGYNDAADRRATSEDIQRWIQGTYDLIEAAFGKQEAETFKSNDGYPFEEPRIPILAESDPRRHDVSIMEVRLWRLANLGREAHKLPIENDFDPDTWSPRDDAELRREIERLKASPDRLKGVCLHISQDITDFIKQRQKTDPGFEIYQQRKHAKTKDELNEIIDRENEARRQHEAETLRLYHERYKDRVMGIYHELSTDYWFGVDDREYFENPADEDDIETVAWILKTAASRM